MNKGKSSLWSFMRIFSRFTRVYSHPVSGANVEEISECSVLAPAAGVEKDGHNVGRQVAADYDERLAAHAAASGWGEVILPASQYAARALAFAMASSSPLIPLKPGKNLAGAACRWPVPVCWKIA